MKIGRFYCIGVHVLQDKVNEVEDYVTADLRPRSSWDASVQSGYIPSNTADVLAARFRSRR